MVRKQVVLEYFTKIKVQVQSQHFLAGLAYLFMHASSKLTRKFKLCLYVCAAQDVVL